MNKLNQSKFLSLCYDGATDSSVTEVEINYVRYYDNEQNMAKSCYFSLAEVQHAHAEGVFSAISESLNTLGPAGWLEKLVTVTSDGARVNIGAHNSVATRMRDNGHDYVLIFYCLAHRLELAVLRAIRQNDLLDAVKDVLMKLHKHYHSAKAQRELQQIAEAMESNVLKPTRLSGTRWTPHMSTALKHLWDGYTALLSHFQHVVESRSAVAEVIGRARFLVQKLTDPVFLHFVCFMRDMLEVISELSLTLQKDSCTVAHMLDAVEYAALRLVELQQGPGAHVEEFVTSLQGCPAGALQYKGIDLHPQALRGMRAANQADDIPNDEHYRHVCHPVLVDVIDQISQVVENPRDQLIAESVPVIRACSVFHTADWPGTREDLARFGTEDLQCIIDQFQPLLERHGVDLAAIRNEWTRLKAVVKPPVHANAPQIHRKISDYKQDARFTSIMAVYELVSVIPIASANCERGFSALKRIKSDWRSRLDTAMADLLLLVSVEGVPLEEYNAYTGLQRWWNGAQRRRRPQFRDNDQEQEDHDLVNFLLNQP